MNFHATCLLAFKSSATSPVEWHYLSILDMLYPNDWSMCYWFDRSVNFWKQVRSAKEDFMKREGNDKS